LNAQASTWGATDGQGAPEGFEPLAHSCQAEPFHDFPAAAIIACEDHEAPIRGLPDLYSQLARLRVAQGVGDQLLNTTQNRIGARGIEGVQIIRYHETHAQTGQAFGQGLQRRPQIHRLDANLADDVSHFTQQSESGSAAMDLVPDSDAAG
jgi:hypothetical protein